MNANIDLTKLTNAQLIEMLNERRNQAAKVSFKVSEKGCMTMHGGRLRRFGLTLYASEWETVLTNVDAIKSALAANKSNLSYK